jgi:hypothetical protein
MIIKLKLDLTKVDKTKLFRSEKTSAVYLDVTLLENKNGVDQYGNSFMAVQDVSKEAREAGEKGAILGNGKIFVPKNSSPTAQAKASQEDAPW